MVGDADEAVRQHVEQEAADELVCTQCHVFRLIVVTVIFPAEGDPLWPLWPQASRYWGGTGTNVRYLCKGDYDDGGQYCIGFGGATVDRRLGQELLKVISPFGVEASVKAIEELSSADSAQRAALSNKLEQLQYEAKRAFKQYDLVDARNRLAAAELERRWNEKLEEIEAVQRQRSSLEGERHSLSSEEEARILAMGENFAEVWQSDRCPPTLKKMIFRTTIEEIIVRTDAKKETLHFTIHWKGGVHTDMDRPRSATETATPVEALEIIRRMAVRHGDDQIASVLNRLGYVTGKGNRWNQNRVAAARKNYSIAGQKRAAADPERVSLNEAARLCGVSHRSIERLVEAGLLNREQVAPPRVLLGEFVAPLWTQNRFAALSSTSVGQASSFYEGVARKINLSCSLKIKELMMPGIMSEGSGEGSAPRYGGRQ